MALVAVVAEGGGARFDVDQGVVTSEWVEVRGIYGLGSQGH